jgi:hypothetical protein
MPAATAFVVIFIAEWGDLTQILTANLAAHYHSPVSVGVGALIALWAVAAIAVVGGQSLLKVVNIATIRYATAVILLGLAGYAAWTTLRRPVAIRNRLETVRSMLGPPAAGGSPVPQPHPEPSRRAGDPLARWRPRRRRQFRPDSFAAWKDGA